MDPQVLFSLLTVILVGHLLTLTIRYFPHTSQAFEWMGADRFASKLDVNKATIDQLMALPYIGEFTARKIIDYRKRVGKFNSLDEIATIKGVRKDLYDNFIQYLKLGPS